MYQVEIEKQFDKLNKKNKFYRHLVFNYLKNMKNCFIKLNESNQDYYVFGDPDSNNVVEIEVFNPSCYKQVILHGSIGAGESFINGHWNTKNLTNFIKVMIKNEDVIDLIDSKLNFIFKLKSKLEHYFNKNSIVQAKKNISSHYDIGNDLYQLFLDERMQYSSGYFGSDFNISLDEAQINKLDLIAKTLNVSSSDHILEIGTGWGGLSIYLASEYGCQVTTTTISQEQYNYTKSLIQKLGLQNKINLLLKDYRELDGTFNKIVSVEMIEAVGKKFIPKFFNKCNELLDNNGLILIQSILMKDQRHKAYSNQVDFIQKYIFPGGYLPSISAFLKESTNHSNLVLKNYKDLGQDYAKTLEIWHEKFNQNKDAILMQGYDEKFIKTFQFYFSYCQGGFEEKSISVAQILLEKNI